MRDTPILTGLYCTTIIITVSLISQKKYSKKDSLCRKFCTQSLESRILLTAASAPAYLDCLVINPNTRLGWGRGISSTIFRIMEAILVCVCSTDGYCNDSSPMIGIFLLPVPHLSYLSGSIHEMNQATKKKKKMTKCITEGIIKTPIASYTAAVSIPPLSP